MTGKARILLVIAGLPAGGAERQMSLLARGLDRERFDVGLLIFGRAERIHYRDVFEAPLWFRALELTSAMPRPLMLARMFAGIRAAWRDFRPDLVHSSLNVANHAVRATAALSFRRTPIVTSVRVDFRDGYRAAEKRAERLLAPFSRRIVCNAESTARQLVEDLRLAPSRVVTIENGLDPRFSPDSAAPRPEGWPDAPVALVVGRFTAQKNQVGLLAALIGLEAAGRLGDWRFVLVGEGPLAAEVAAAAAPLGSRVALMPPVADPLPLYRAADLVILPSLFEGMPNVALEAQSCGVPVAIGGAANAAGAVAPGNGWGLDGDLAEALATALAAPPAEHRRRGTLAAADMQARFSAGRMVRATEGVYRQCLKP